MFAIFQKEINAFFSSLIGYVVLGIFLLLTGLAMWVFPDTNILDTRFASLEAFFELSPMIFLFLIPAVTMRLLAEETQLGTIELLTTRPLTDWQILLGKYWAAVVLVLIALVPTLLYVLTVYQLGSPVGNMDLGATMGSYIGLLLLGSVFAAIGLFASSLTNNQIIAFLTTVFLCFLVHWGFDFFSRLPFLIGKADDWVQALGGEYHYRSISRGVVDLSDTVYFTSVIFVFLQLTLLSLERRKW